MPNENRKRAARSGWTRRRGEAPQQPSQTEPEPGSGAPDGGAARPSNAAVVADREPLFAAYRAAKAKHDEAIAALKRATRARTAPHPDLVRAQTEAALEEIDALTALRAGVRL
jgi:hypothetical protein